MPERLSSSENVSGTGGFVFLSYNGVQEVSGRTNIVRLKVGLKRSVVGVIY